jgi:regulator of RNase E activity RraA
MSSSAVRDRVRDALHAHLHEGDLTCLLCDRGAAAPLRGDWPVRFGGRSFVGPARIAVPTAGGLTPILAAIDALGRGDVLLVVAPDADAAVLGGRLAARACRAGAAGALIDGRVRDVPTLRNQPLPVVARGVAPMRSDATGPGAREVGVTVGGSEVAPGDLVLADENGVVVLRRDAYDAVLADLDAWLEQERTADRAAGVGGPP